ncbi:unnamed protein product [Rotaria sordida]|uniref:Transposase n=1 Tax=Rotaria sordida TaxID=392033 RepID=A0A813T5S6_9BILA|nr:unnamed protein product [Rotaria sordida]
MTQACRRDYQRAQCVALTLSLVFRNHLFQRALKRYEETGEFQDRPRAGRPKKLNERNIRMLKRLVQKGERYSVGEIAIKLNDTLNSPVTSRTIINYLHRCRYEYKTKITKPFLNKNVKKNRLNWCLDYSNWTINQWKNIIFSDATCFYVIKRKNKTKIWRTKDERWKESCMHVAAAGGGGRVDFYGTITSEGTDCFRIYNENTNSDVYCDILDNYLIPTVQLYQMENNYFCQHDNSKYHLSKQTQMKFHELGVKVLKRPSKSPALNPIESLWTVIDNKLKSKSLSSVKELIEALSKAWLPITPQLCQKFVFSMPRRIQKCIAVNSKCIDY